MTTNIKVGGAWKEATPYIKVGGVWKKPDSVFIKVGGVWKEVFTAELPPIWTAGYTVTYYGSPYSAQLYINAAGTVVLTNGTNGSWLPSGASAAAYQIKWQLLSGNTPTNSSGFTQNTFVPLSASRTLSVTGTSSTTRSCNVRLTLQEIATGAQIVVDVFMEGGGFV